MEMDSYPTKKSSTNFDKTEDFFGENEDNEDLLIKQSKSHRRKKRQAPYLIFPEILCIIDYDGYRYEFTAVFPQCAERILNKIAKPFIETFTRLMCILQGFRICFV